MCTKFYSENLKGSDHLGDLNVDVKVKLSPFLNIKHHAMKT
jgi:hypothetical protein